MITTNSLLRQTLTDAIIDRIASDHVFDTENMSSWSDELQPKPEAVQADVRYGYSPSFYDPIRDYIRLPYKENLLLFFSSAFHELGHWTGHSTRLNRAGLTVPSKIENLAREELIGTLTSAFLRQETGIQFDLEYYGSEIRDWLEPLVPLSTLEGPVTGTQLRKLKAEIARAATAASVAADFLLCDDDSRYIFAIAARCDTHSLPPLNPTYVRLERL